MMSLHRRGKYWYYDFRFQGKRYKASTKETKKGRAEEVLANLRRNLREGNLGPVIEDVSFGDLADKYLKSHAAGKRGAAFYQCTVRVLRDRFGDAMLSTRPAGS